jgi:hypothetical protein
VRVREAIGDYIVVVVGAQRGGKPRQRVRACELMKGGEGKEGEESGTGRRGCRVGPAVGVRVPHRARGACVPGWLRFAVGSDV